MSSDRIKALLNPPSHEQSKYRAKEALNSKFQSVDDLEGLETLVLQFNQRHDELNQKVGELSSNSPRLAQDWSFSYLLLSPRLIMSFAKLVSQRMHT